MTETIDRETMHAISADTRREIIKLLSKRPHTASELSQRLGKHVTTITEHLGVLERTNVVRKKESTNKWIYYELTSKGTNFFRPHYYWAIMSLSLIAFVAGLYEILFVSYRATLLKIGETANAPQMAATATTATTVTYDTNLYIGAILVVLSAAALWLTMRKKRHLAAMAETAYIENQ